MCHGDRGHHLNKAQTQPQAKSTKICHFQVKSSMWVYCIQFTANYLAFYLDSLHKGEQLCLSCQWVFQEATGEILQLFSVLRRYTAHQSCFLVCEALIYNIKKDA